MANDLNIVYRIAADITGLQTGVDKAAKATEALASTASKMGTAIVGAFSITAVEQFAQTIIGTASAFRKMADQTGLSTDEVQKLDFIAGQTDVSISSLVGAVQNLQQRLGDDNSGAVGALVKLGLNAEAFNKLSTYEQVTALSDAIRGIKDPTEQASLAAAVFGKNWKEILPAIKSGMKEVGDQAPIMSKATVEALDRIDDALKKARAEGTAWSGSFVLAIEGAGFALGEFLSKFSPEHFGITSSEFNKLAAELNDPDGAIRAFGASTEAAKKLVTQGMDPLRKILPPTAIEMMDLNAQIHKSIEENTKAAEATKKAEDALKHWNQSVTDATIHMNLSVFTLHRFGAVELPAVESSLKDVDTEIHLLTSRDLPDFSTQIVVAGQKGVKSFGDLRTAVQKFVDRLQTSARDIGSILDNIGGKFAETGAIIARTVDAVITRLKSGDLLGAFIAGVSGAISAIKKLFTDTEKQVNPVRQAFIDAAGGLDRLNQRAYEAGVTLTAVLDAKNPEAYKKAIDDLTAALQFQDESMKFLDETVKKYGFSIEELGPKFVQQQLSKQAFDLEKEFRALEAAGIDVTTISTHMADAINEFLHNALKTGAQVPESLRPILQQLANMGLLTDANGDAITDLEAAGVHFSKTLDQQFQTLIETIQKLVDAISRGLGTAIANIPDPTIEGRVTWKVDPFQPTNDFPIQTFATGGIVRGPSGSDTVPAMLTPGEMVLTQEQQQALGDYAQPITITVQTMLDGRLVAENTITKIAQDKSGLRTKTQRALGIA